MKRFFTILFIAFATIACESNETPTAPNQPQDNPGIGEIENFYINIKEDQLSAFSVTFDILPEHKEDLYYYDIISKGRLSEVSISSLKAEIIAGAEKMAELTGSSFDEVLATMLTSGDKLDICSNAGYRPETDFVIYAFYWDEEDEENLCLREFRTPAVVASSESAEVEATIDAYSMNIEVTPSAGVVEYYYYFNERTKVEAMLAGLEDENAYLSYQAMNVGTRKEGAATFEQLGLKPQTEYMVLLMCIDNKLNRFAVSEVFTTTEENTSQRVESELFEKLLGEWEGKQTIYDYYASPQDNVFDVNILSSIEDVDCDYRALNQLVATVDGWCNIPYYGLTSLIEQEIEDPEDKWGPRWIFNIGEGDVVTMDGKVRNSVIGWLFFGNCYMLNMSVDGTQIVTDQDLVVEISEDYNTITIKSPVSGLYPGLAYYFEGVGWMGYYSGCSNIVLTRK